MTTEEAYFRALGWKIKEEEDIGYTSNLQPEDRHLNVYVDCEGNDHCIDCSGWPNITQHYPDFKKWVLERMEGEGILIEVQTDHDIRGKNPPTQSILLRTIIRNGRYRTLDLIDSEPITNNEFLEDIVIMLTRYFKEKKDGNL